MQNLKRFVQEIHGAGKSGMTLLRCFVAPRLLSELAPSAKLLIQYCLLRIQPE